MDKNYICQEALENIKNATKMETVVFDEKTNERKTEFFDVTDIARQSAIDAITKFQNSEKERVNIYHGQSDVDDRSYYLEIRDGKLTLVTVIDYGMMVHNDYNKPEEMLYQFDVLEKEKPYLTTVEEPKKEL